MLGNEIGMLAQPVACALDLDDDGALEEAGLLGKGRRLKGDLVPVTANEADPVGE